MLMKNTFSQDIKKGKSETPPFLFNTLYSAAFEVKHFVILGNILQISLSITGLGTDKLGTGVAKQGDVGKEPQLFGRESPLKVGEVCSTN